MWTNMYKPLNAIRSLLEDIKLEKTVMNEKMEIM